jgi:MFS family permease
VTALATGALGLAANVAAFVTLRGVAWVSRGFRGPLRDALLADAVEQSHYGRAYGLERVGDMLGAVAGPLLATLLVWGGLHYPTIIVWSVVPGVAAAAAMYFLTTEREPPRQPSEEPAPPPIPRPAFPRGFWLFLVGVSLFGMGDFSRTFLIWLAARGLGEDGGPAAGGVPLAVLLYAIHNLVSAVAAYPIGHAGDRRSRLGVLIPGYAVGVGTNLLLAGSGGSLGWLVVAIVLSGVYVAAEETLEKATAAEMLPRELRSLGFGVLACVNGVGDMLSSLYVGLLLEANRPVLAFSLAAGFGLAGVVWLACQQPRRSSGEAVP